jgi:hypothetical protein
MLIRLHGVVLWVSVLLYGQALNYVYLFKHKETPLKVTDSFNNSTQQM